MKSTKHNKTNILPLRWLVNGLNTVATSSLVKAFSLQEDNKLGFRFKLHCKVWHYLNKPYTKYGTYYSVDLESIDKDVL